MSTLVYIIIFTLIGSVVSLIGGVLLLMNEKFAIKISHFLTAFAAGTLLGTAFFDLLPESMDEAKGSDTNIFFWVLIGILAFFLLERFIHHHDQGEIHKAEKSIIPLIVIGDTLHNFIDGVAMAATFLISVPLGIVTSLAVAAHEIPQEIGDFGLMLNRGVKREKVLLINLYSAFAAIAGAILTYILKDSINGFLPVVLAITAGFFIYIASANLIPEIHGEDKKDVAFWETVCLFLGVALIYLVITYLEGAVAQ